MRKAFTLVEMLVVVGIIALLIALLLPALKNVRYSAMTSECQVRLRSIAQVQLSHAIDHDQFFPEAGGYEYGSKTDLDGGSESGSWFHAGPQHGARVRSWELVGTVGDGQSAGGAVMNKRQYDLRQTYYDYMQNYKNMEAVIHCPFIHRALKDYYGFENKEDKASTYMIYVTNNYRTKHFYYHDVGAYQRLGDTWSPLNKPDENFTMLASDVALGNFGPHGVKDDNGDPIRGVLSAHPAPNGAIYEHQSQINDWPGYVLDESQDAPLNFADVDGSVQMYRVNANSINDTDTWVVHNQGNHRNALLPRSMTK